MKQQYRIWLLPYGNFDPTGEDYYNPSWGLAWKVKQLLNQATEVEFLCRLKRVGVNIYDVDDAVDEVAYYDKSTPEGVDIVVAIGLYAGLKPVLFKFEHKGDADHNKIPDPQYDLYGNEVPNIKEYHTLLSGAEAGWHKIPWIKELARSTEQKAGQEGESRSAGDYLCGYMTEKLASESTLTDKSFFIHTRNFNPEKDDKKRDESATLIAEFIKNFCARNRDRRMVNRCE